MARSKMINTKSNSNKGQIKSEQGSHLNLASLRSEGNMAHTDNYPILSKSAISVFRSIKKHAIGSCMIAGVATSLLFASSNANALGLGVLDVQSNLDQPLNGVITVSVAPGDDLNTLKAEVASREEFESLGVDYPEYLKNIKLAVDRSGQGAVLRVTSDGVVIKEPFIHFLVKVSWSGGNFLREYTALIDPPVYAAEAPKSVAQPKLVGTDQSYSDDESSSYQEPASPIVEQVEEAEQANETVADSDSNYSNTAADARYGPVEAGESLSLIAQELQKQFPDLSIYSIMQVLFEENRNAFIDNNINGLIKGSILNVGDLNQIRAADVEEARAFFQSQVAAWNPSSLGSSSSGVGVTQDTYNGEDTVFGSDFSGSTEIEDNFQIGSSDDTGSFVSSGSGDSNEGEVLALRQQLTQLQSSLASSELENQELSERISILETQLEDMNRLMSLSVENADLAVLEDTLAKQNAEKDLAPLDGLGDSISEFVDESVDTVDGAIDDLSGDLTDNSLTDGELLDADSTTETVDDVLGEFLNDDAEESVTENTVDGENIDELAGDIASDSDVDSVIDEVVDDINVVASEPVKPAVVNSAPVKQESLLDKVGGLVPALGGLGALLAAGLGLFWYRRRRADEEFEISMLSIESNSQSIDVDTKSGQSASVSASVSTTSSVSEAAPKEEVDKETSFLTVYSDSDAVVQADEVDPIAEADVYIAYGRDEQAEEVLLDGVTNHPDRVDVKQKLLGLYFKNKNTEGFERVSEELYAQRDAMSGEAWQEISDMGKELLPDNPLFALSGSDFDAVDKAEEVVDSTESADESNDAGDAADIDDDALVFDTVDESADEEVAAAQIEQQEAEQALDDLDIASIEDDESIQLIQFDEDRSEISELDEIQIDALPIEDDDVLSLDSAEEQDDVVELDLGDVSDSEQSDNVEVELSENDLVFDIDESNDEPQQASNDLGDDETEFGSERKISEVPEVSDLVIDPDYDEAQTQYELAKVFVDLGDDDGARKILEDLVDNASNSEELVKNAQELLDSIAS